MPADPRKQEQIDAARRQHALKNRSNSLTELQKENALLRKKLAKEQERLKQVKGIAVNMQSLARRMNNATPRMIIDWSTRILEAINR